MKKIAFAFGGLVVLAASPAAAQMGQGGLAGAPTPKPQQRVPDIAPAGLPGAAGAPGLATAPTLKKPETGNPTEALFTAINKDDYASAQDAVGRGADLYATNQLGETPLDLAISLNRTTIMFLLLQTRNETGGGPISPGPAFPAAKQHGPHATPAASHLPQHHREPAHAATPPVMGNNPGTPDPSAGFLGFGPKS
ncbi:MAG: hypothetical protein B7Z81_04260 [Acidocella sp. 20-61-6]|nr:MAG: hypothetical protein B7Z81_04260 [Acidocella sp. 20-61-6]